MTRLSDVERAERKMVRARLEGMDTLRLMKFAAIAGVSPEGKTRLAVVNELMNCYKRTWGSSWSA